jgi:protein TonB
MNQNSLSFVESSFQGLCLPAPVQVQTSRRYSLAWGISGVAHALLFAVAFWGGTQILEAPRPTIRLVFVEPPPPPPVPPGAPTAEGVTPVPQQPPAVVEKPKVQEQPKPKELERLKIVKKKKLPTEPKPRQPEPPVPPQPEAVPEPAPVVAAAQAGITTGVPDETNHGVVGGVAGGHVGGVIGSHGTEPLSVDQVANPPLLLSRVTPDYPRGARRQGVEGLVVLEAILNLEGQIEDDIKVLHSVPLLDDAAVQAVRRWRFRPARDHTNQPVRVILEVPVRFVLR